MLITPEGTRSYSGALAKGLPGVVLLAIRSKAPILPVAFYGNEDVKENLKHLKRTRVVYRVGQPFTINYENQAFSREFRQDVTDQIMYQIAALLPPKYRGVYSDLSKATKKDLCFISTRNK
jgi:1-acyl-sn-glycerol-3-phosphate acyltransferase